jgi:putative heme-binding domain-containing protein
MGLAQQPDGDNWPLLVKSVATLEGQAAVEVIRRLCDVDRKTDDPEAIRQVILRGLSIEGPQAAYAVALLQHWTGSSIGRSDDVPKAALASWQSWYRKKYPALPDPSHPVDSNSGKWTYDALLATLESPDGSKGSPARGAHVYAKGQCVKCHQFSGRGDGAGPDLTTVGRRFTRKEIVQSILFPSHVISDQYASKIIVTTDGRTVTGVVTRMGGNHLVQTASGEHVVIADDDVDEIAPSKISSMPEGLLDELTGEEIVDLFAYLLQPSPARITRTPAPTETK